MDNEEVLFHSDAANVTVTEQRVIYGDEVYDIGSIKHAAWVNSNGIKDHLIAILFGVIGVWLVTFLNGWSILGLILLSNPALVFLGKKKYLVFIYLKSGSTIDDGENSSRRFCKRNGTWDIGRGQSGGATVSD